MTMKLIATIEVGAGGAAFMSFSSIPQTYTDLYLVVSGRSTDSAPSIYFTFNGSGGTYTTRWLYGTGANAYSSNNSGNGFIRFDTQGEGTSYTANTFGNTAVYIPNYASSTNKTISVDSVTETNATNVYSMIGTSVWSLTSGITGIDVDIDGNFVQYSTASLYGIQKGSGGATIA